MGPADDDLVKVLATGNQATVAVARSLLADAGIEYLDRNDFIQHLLPLPLSGLVEFWVHPADAAAARDALAGLQ